MEYYFRRNGVPLDYRIENKESAIKGAKLLGVDRVFYTENGRECWFLVGEPTTTALKEVALDAEREAEKIGKSPVVEKKPVTADSANGAASVDSSQPQSKPKRGQLVRVKIDRAPLYSAPSPTSAQVGVVAFGVDFKFECEMNGYYFCRVKNGWIQGEFVEIVC